MTQTAVQRRYIRLAAATNQKAARLGLEGRVLAEDLAHLFIASEGKCPYCGIDINPLDCSFDHVLSFDRGGANDPSNMLACCLTCQRSKSVKSPEEYEMARTLLVHCEVCDTEYKPRWADYVRGLGRTCSPQCAGMKGKLTQMANRA